MARLTADDIEDVVRAQAMERFDRLSKRWRTLVNEYGYNITMEMMDSFDDPDAAEMALETRRLKRERDKGVAPRKLR